MFISDDSSAPPHIALETHEPSHLGESPEQMALAVAESIFKKQANHPGKLQLLTRSLYALDDILSRKADERALFARSNLDVLLALTEDARALTGEPTSPLASESANPTFRPEQIEHLRSRGRDQLERLLRERGGTLSSLEVAERLGITRQAVNQRRQKGQLLAVQQGQEYRYPAWQLSANNQTISGLEEVLRACEALPPSMQIQLLLTPHPSLSGRIPLDALLAGELAPVIHLAALAGHHGAL